MNENRKQILAMLAEGKITPDEAERLISAVETESSPSGSSTAESRSQPKYLRVVVESDDEHSGHGATKVNIRVPMQLLRAGVKLASLIPAVAQDRINEALRKEGLNIDVSQIKPENLEEIVDQLKDLTVDVDDSNNKVRVFCE